MRIIQDSLRKKQALLASALMTLGLICVTLFILYSRAMSQVNEGINALQNQMTEMFNDNELIADATGVRFQQISSHAMCGEADIFEARGSAWGINANPQALDLQRGAMVARTQERRGRCMYLAAEFVRQKSHALNPALKDIHRYVIASDASWFYWFNASDSVPFNFDTSQMANNLRKFFSEPEPFYDRVLQTSVLKKSRSSTDFYDDKITGSKAYSVVSYIYDLSEGEASNHIVAYLVYDLSSPQLMSALKEAFNNRVQDGLILGFQNRRTGELLCIVNDCSWLDNYHTHTVSSRYEIKYALPFWSFLGEDPAAMTTLALAPVLLILLFILIRFHLNRADLRFYRDALTGCFTRNIFSVIQQRSLPYMTVILFDCNKFKSINDSYGHQVGDLALQAIAGRMLDSVRANGDWVIRSGGDEFIVLLSRTDVAHAHMVAERIASGIAMLPFSVQGTPVPVSVSWGVASCRDSLDEAIQQADAEMYQMKKRRGERG
ncbi:TPA: GGDEF domain-containing protein [Kluyvera ascorbata]|nr:GGDEF domain-containing protein [Kluyvera ascorbata]